MVLLAGAGLLVRSLWSVEGVNLGFRPERVLLVWLAPLASIPSARRADYYQRVLKQVQSLPGLESAGVASEVFIGSGSPVPLTA